MKISIRPMVVADREAFVALTMQRPGYGEDAARRRTALVWHIAFENPTSDGQPTYFVATDGERILCHVGRMPTWFFVEGRRHLAAFAHDLFSHPEIRAGGSGFFTTMKLYRALEDHSASFCGLLWTNEINVKLQQTRKYDQLWTRRWVRPLEVDAQVRRYVPFALLHPAARAMGRAALRATDAVLALRGGRLPCMQITYPDDRFDRFAERVGPLLGTAPVKDRAYVLWKYFAWPGLRTRVFAVPGSGRDMRGFVVLREPEAAADPGRILDLVVDPDDEEAASSLVVHAIAHYRRARLSRVECMATFPPLAAILERHFFVQRPPDLPLFFLNGHKYANVEHLRRLETWSHAFGDSEGGEVP